jgi:predicted nucleotidyltransferase
MVSSMNIDALVAHLHAGLPSLLAVYLFGSQASGTAGAESDLDLAVLVAGEVEPLRLWQLSGELADIAGVPVDLLDLRAASTVMQYQIITRGRRLWAADAQAALFESFILSEKTALDGARAGLLADIQREGRVYGR